MFIPYEFKAATMTPLKHNRKKLSRFSLQNRLFCLYRLLAVIKLHMHIIYHLLVTIWFYVSSMFIPSIFLMFVQSKEPLVQWVSLVAVYGSHFTFNVISLTMAIGFLWWFVFHFVILGIFILTTSVYGMGFARCWRIYLCALLYISL